MNDMVKANSGSVPTVASLVTDLTNYTQTQAPAGSPGGQGKPFLRMLKHGEWVFGKEDDQVTEEDIFAVNPLSIKHGYVAWGEDDSPMAGKKVKEVMVTFKQRKPDIAEMPSLPHARPWAEQVSVELAIVDGELKGQEVLYSTSSVGGLDFHKALVEAIVAQASADPENPVLLITLHNSNYKHPQYGKIFKPEFKVVGATGLDASEVTADAVEDGTSEDAEPAPKRRTRAKQETKSEAAPKRRTRSK